MSYLIHQASFSPIDALYGPIFVYMALAIPGMLVLLQASPSSRALYT